MSDGKLTLTLAPVWFRVLARILGNVPADDDDYRAATFIRGNVVRAMASAECPRGRRPVPGHPTAGEPATRLLQQAFGEVCAYLIVRTPDGADIVQQVGDAA